MAVGVVAVALDPMRREGLALASVAGLALLAGPLGDDVLESLLEGPAPAPARITGHAEDVVKFLGDAALSHVCVLPAVRVLARVPAATGGSDRPGAGTPGPGPATPASGDTLVPLTSPAAAPSAGSPTSAESAESELTAPPVLPRGR